MQHNDIIRFSQALIRNHPGCDIRIKSILTVNSGCVVLYDRVPVGERATGLDNKRMERLGHFRMGADEDGEFVRLATDIITE
jgi:hypothetical protein